MEVVMVVVTAADTAAVKKRSSLSNKHLSASEKLTLLSITQAVDMVAVMAVALGSFWLA